MRRLKHLLKHPYVAPEMEPTIRQLYGWVASAGEAILHQFGFPAKPFPDRLAAVSFYCAVHEGFRKAQQQLIELLIARQGATDIDAQQEEATFRKLADTIAWQILGNQLYLGRRLFRDQAPPTLRQSNLESVIATADEMQGEDLGKFALISDLTSFVQVGDLLVSEPLEGLVTVVEVKDGHKNEKIVEFAQRWAADQSPEDLTRFGLREGKKAAEQAKRIVRQLARLKHFTEIATTGESVDPDTNEPVRVPQETFVLEKYDDALSAAIDRAKKHSWATEVVDDCLFIGAYANRMRRVSETVFSRWLHDEEGWVAGYPLSDFMQSMSTSLAMPIFTRNVSPDHIFDLLFGRVHVKMGLHLDNFLTLARRMGVSMRWSSRKHAAEMARDSASLVLNNRMIVADRGDVELTIFDGVVTRIFFEGIRPSSFIRMIDVTLDSMQHVHDDQSDGG